MKLDSGIVMYVIIHLIINKSKHNISKSHNHKDNYSVVFKNMNSLDQTLMRYTTMRRYLNKKCAEDCYNKCFHTFKLRCIYDVRMTNVDFLNGIISDKNLKKIVRENGFIHKLTKKVYSSLSNINKGCYLKFRIPIMHRKLFFRNISKSRICENFLQ